MFPRTGADRQRRGVVTVGDSQELDVIRSTQEGSRAYLLAAGQVAEWLVWVQLAASSRGDLHVFLPLKDEGVDGIVHRISTDGYARVQVKGRHRAFGGIEVRVPEHELRDERATVVAVETRANTAQLGPHAVVVDVPTFRRRARTGSRSPGIYQTHVALPPRAGQPWSRWCVPLAQIGDSLLPPVRGSQQRK
jgi:hypothetical protein